MFVLCARGGGGYGAGEQMEHANFQDPYLKHIFGQIGITDITFLHDEKTLSNESNLEKSIDEARQLAQTV
jgi:FMN-dependent NADH-azoreductase